MHRWRLELPIKDVCLDKGIVGNNALYHILAFRDVIKGINFFGMKGEKNTDNVTIKIPLLGIKCLIYNNLRRFLCDY